MGKILSIIRLVVIALNFTFVLSQDSVINMQIDLDAPDTFFDFWVGTWDATWDEGQGKKGKGINRITKTLDDKVFHEDFQVLKGQGKGFKGTSISVYQSKLGRWKQAWADNQGGYFDFVGEIDGNNRIFKTTQSTMINDKKVTSRMVFKAIKEDSFIWDWESSRDEGKTWNLLWRINYTRLK